MSQNKDHFSRHRESHYKDLFDGSSYTGKMAYLHWGTQHTNTHPPPPHPPVHPWQQGSWGQHGPIWGRQDPGGPHVGPMNIAIWDGLLRPLYCKTTYTLRTEKARTTRTPAFWGYPPPPHDYPYHWVILDPKSKEDKVKVTNLKNSPKFHIFEFWNNYYMRHTFWSCLIRCANMKWIRWVLLKIQRGHDSVHRRTDGQTDKVKPVYPPFNFVEAGGIITN